MNENNWSYNPKKKKSKKVGELLNKYFIPQTIKDVLEHNWEHYSDKQLKNLLKKSTKDDIIKFMQQVDDITSTEDLSIIAKEIKIQLQVGSEKVYQDFLDGLYDNLYTQLRLVAISTILNNLLDHVISYCIDKYKEINKPFEPDVSYDLHYGFEWT